MAKKAYIGVENFKQRELPSGYTQVEYIQSSGTQYVDTGFVPNQDTRIVMDATVLNVDSTNVGGFFFGSGYPTQQNGFEAYIFNNVFCGVYNGSQVDGNATVSVGQRMAIDFNKNVCFVTADGVTVYNNTFTYSTFTSTTNLALFVLPRSTKFYGVLKLYSCQIYDNDVLVRDFVPCTNASGAAGLYDMVNNQFYENAGTGAFSVGSTYASYARKIKKSYIGVDGKARKIKKGYIGVGGKARPFWSGGELTYYGTVSPLSIARQDAPCAAIGGRLLVAGGTTSGSVGGTKYATVDTYDHSMTRGNATDLSNARYEFGGVTVNGAYALFFGGTNASSVFATVDAYNAALTKTTPTSLSTAVRLSCGLPIGTNAVIAGGHNKTSWSYSNLVNSYSSNLTRSVLSTLPKAMWCSGATVGKYGLFAGLYKDSLLTVAYDANLTRTTLSQTSCGVGCSGENYAIFAMHDYAYAHEKDLTQIILTPMTVAREYPTAVGLQGYSIYAGGAMTDFAEVYLETTLVPVTGLSAAKQSFYGGSLGDYAFFPGGRTNAGVTNSTEVYAVN